MWQRLSSKLALRLPSQCAVCHAWPAQAICEDCIAQFAQPRPRCPHCAHPVAHQDHLPCRACAAAATPPSHTLAAVDYQYPWSGLLQAFKFQGHAQWARHLALLMRSMPGIEPALEAADGLVAMPLARRRLQSRGFNQSLLLAQELAAHKVQPDSLLRITETLPQHSLTREQRWHNVRHCFAVAPDQIPLIRGRHMVLVDDIMTTGASLHAARQTLLQAGARQVTGLVFARTPSDGSDAVLSDCYAPESH